MSDPDNAVIVRGAGAPFAPNVMIQLVYQVKVGADNCGPYMVGTAQEMRTNRFFLGQRIPDDTGFGPAYPTTTFRLYSSQIFDDFFLSIDLWDFLFLDIGEEISSMDQEFRIAISDPCNQNYAPNLGKRRVVCRKISDWEVQAEVTGL